MKKNAKSPVKLETTNTILEEKFNEKLKVRAVQEKFQKPDRESVLLTEFLVYALQDVVTLDIQDGL